MRQLRLLLLPFSFVYGLITYFRNLLYNFGILSSYSIPGKSISVGNLAIGGTGKTPHVAYLTNLLKETTNITILSRGYGRKTKGFILADEKSTGTEIGDEPKLYVSRFFPKVNIVVCEKREIGVQKIQKLLPQNQLILLDDAFQHRAIKAGLNLLLTDFNSLYSSDFVLPAGNLREFRIGRKRADLVIVTKCPNTLDETKKQIICQKLKFEPNNVFFSVIKYGELIPFGEKQELEIKNVLLVTGIANPKPLIEELEKKHTVKTLTFPDHYNFTVNDIEEIHQNFDTFAVGQKIIITTEKDFMRLSELIDQTKMNNYPWYYQTIDIEIDKTDTFNNLIYNYVNTI